MSDCRSIISVASVMCMQILHVLHCTRPCSPHNVMHSPSYDWVELCTTFTTKVGVSYVYNRNDDMPGSQQLNGITPPMLFTWLSSPFGGSLGIMAGGGTVCKHEAKCQLPSVSGV